MQVICGNELSKEYLLTVGTKTGCPLSVVLFVIQLDRSLKEVHNHAIISLNVQDEKGISPIPVGGYADDIAFISLLEKILRDMVNGLFFSITDKRIHLFYAMYQEQQRNDMT